jgi:hypothetical protein
MDPFAYRVNVKGTYRAKAVSSVTPAKVEFRKDNADSFFRRNDSDTRCLLNPKFEADTIPATATVLEMDGRDGIIRHSLVTGETNTWESLT